MKAPTPKLKGFDADSCGWIKVNISNDKDDIEFIVPSLESEDIELTKEDLKHCIKEVLEG